MPLSVKDIPEAGPDTSIEQDSDAESGQRVFFVVLEATQATPYPTSYT